MTACPSRCACFEYLQITNGQTQAQFPKLIQTTPQSEPSTEFPIPTLKPQNPSQLPTSYHENPPPPLSLPPPANKENQPPQNRSRAVASSSRHPQIVRAPHLQTPNLPSNYTQSPPAITTRILSQRNDELVTMILFPCSLSLSL